MVRVGWKRRAGKILRDLAYWIDPPAKPGRKRRKAVAACPHGCASECSQCEETRLAAEVPLLHGWAEEPRA